MNFTIAQFLCDGMVYHGMWYVHAARVPKALDLYLRPDLTIQSGTYSEVGENVGYWPTREEAEAAVAAYNAKHGEQA